VCALRPPWRSFAASSEGSGAAGKEEKSESDRRFEESGEYDTQDRYKRVGNPIAWANPTGGGTVEDNSSKHWTWIYPAGAAFILLLCLNSRRKNLNKEREAELQQQMDVKAPDMARFSTPAYTPGSAAEPSLAAGDGALAGSSGFSSPPPPADHWNIGGGFSAPPASETWTPGSGR